MRFERRRLRDVVLDPVRRPARRHRRVPIGAAGVDADGESVLLRGGVDRPVGAAAEQHVAHGEQQHLDEAAILRHALDLRDRELRIVHRHQDRRAQPRLAVEQFLRDPVVDGGAQRHRHVLVEQRDRAMQHVADGEPAAERIERLAADHVEGAAGQPRRLPPVRPRAERRIRRIARQVEGVFRDMAIDDLIAPVVVEIGQQGRRAGRRRMKIAVDRAFDRHLHRRSLAVCARLRNCSRRNDKAGGSDVQTRDIGRRPSAHGCWAVSHGRPNAGYRHSHGAAGRDAHLQLGLHRRGCRILQEGRPQGLDTASWSAWARPTR